MKDKNKKIILLVALAVAAYFLLRSNKKSKVEESQGGSSMPENGIWTPGNGGKTSITEEITKKPSPTIPVIPGITTVTTEIVNSPNMPTNESQVPPIHQEEGNVQTKSSSREGETSGPIQTKSGSRAGEVQTKSGSRAGKVSMPAVATVDNNSLYSATVQYSAIPEEKVISAASGQLMYFKSIV